MKKVFVDSDVIIDLLIKREPFDENSKLLFQSGKNGSLKLYTSSDCITNIFYVLRKISNSAKAKEAIIRVLNYVSVLMVDEKIIRKALSSNMIDFEDAVQFLTALNNKIDYFVTRNVSDFKSKEIPVITPVEFLSLP